MTNRTFRHWRDVPETYWRWPSFSPEEIACRGTGALLVDEEAMDRLQQLRTRLGKPIIVLSGYRSPAHNRRVGGAADSQHPKGRAFDVSMANHQPHAFEVAARVAGFTGIGTYPDRGFVHIDTGPARAWGEPFPADAPTFTPEAEPKPVGATNTAKATGAMSAAGAAAVALQALPAVETVQEWLPIVQGVGRLPLWIGLGLIALAAVSVIAWRWRSPR
jgi:zinc D-Ala-D-Ala carboxypeptidase